MADEKDPPIKEIGFVGGVTVIDIGDVRVARGLSRRHYSSCPHRAMVYDNNERRIWCRDCEKDVEPFDAFENLVKQYDKAHSSLVKRQKEVSEAEKFQIRTIAAKKMDEAWRSRTTVPACPHCGLGLFPEDFKLGPSSLGREYAEALAKHRKKPPQPRS